MTPQTLDTTLQHPRIRHGLGEDFIATLQALLTDDVGLMIRHRAMRGNYSNVSDFGQDKAEILIYLFLHLSRYEIQTQTVGTGSETSAPTNSSKLSEPQEPTASGDTS